MRTLAAFVFGSALTATLSGIAIPTLEARQRFGLVIGLIAVSVVLVVSFGVMIGKIEMRETR
jgi:hypothetical protein